MTAAENLRTELTLSWKGKKNTSSYQRIIRTLEALRESLILHYKEYHTIRQALMEASSNGLTGKQRVILRWLAENYREETIYTVLIDRLSMDMGVPKSTTRWNLRGLREAGLIKAGDKDNKGIPVRLTERGRFLAGYLDSLTQDAEHI
ncbi:MAG: hypothetical protein JSV18_04330 [Candidatus Bathyarchaeota archaeon]|nr:MAG: hypothetical protein JSV18_04330 [Candidatus Bathyarchaeota archaeon]